jgi:hypothetical protein
MKIRDILAEIGRERGLSVREDGSLLGMITDFPVLVGSIPYGNLNAICLTVRVGRGDFGALKKAAKGAKGLKSSMLKGLGDGGYLQYVIPYSIFKGRIKVTVIAALNLLMPLVGASFTAPPKTCEVCGKMGVENLVVEGGLPAVICPGCAETIRVKQQAARMAYEATSPDYFKGIIAGLVGAAVGALAWAAVIILFKSTYLVLSAGIGIMVAFFMKKATIIPIPAERTR